MTPQAYPLAWPSFRPRTRNRKDGRFKSHGREVTLAIAADRVEDEVGRLNGKNLVISTNVEPTLSGRPRSNQRKPDDPGVAIYFSLDGDPITLACDRYNEVAQNLAALAAHIDATRSIERHGVQTAKETLKAFAALPAPSDTPAPWHVVLGVSPNASADEIRRAYREKSKLAHPDAGGSTEMMSRLSAAKEAALVGKS